MRMCQHCGAGVPNYAGFCGECGQLVSISKPDAQERTLWMSHPTPPDQAQTTITTETEDTRKPTELALEDREAAELALEDEETRENPVVDNEEENEDGRRRSEVIDLDLSLLADTIVGQSTANVPMVPRTPQIADTPTVVGTPPIAEIQPPPPGSITTTPLVLPDPGRVFTDPLTNGPPHLQRPGNSSHVLNKPQSKQPSGCMVWLIVAIVVPLLILGSIIGIGLTILAPTLALDGSTSVATGDILHLHGGHFIPGNSITCMLDGSIPLSYSSLSYSASGADSMAGALVYTHQRSTAQQRSTTTETGANTTITVGSDGSFSATFVVGPDWKAGQHTIRATEAFSPRSATTTFMVTGNGQTVATATSTATVTAPKTATVTPSSTPSTKPGLSAVTPNIITFGPISEGYTQTASTQVLLNTTGTGLLNWSASWDTTQASWLRLSAQSGQVQEPATQTLIVNAVVGNLKAGTYNTIILFSSNGQSQQNFSLPVSLIIQAGCVKATPTTLNFTATIGANDPAAQTLALNNCGALGSWTETTTGGSWLLVSPTGGNLNKGATQNVLVSASLANVQSGTGTYQGQITFTNGSVRTIVNVTFTVKAAPLPTLATNTTSFSVSQQCTFKKGMWRCSLITLSSSGTAMSNLNWTATSNGIVTITVKPTSGTLQPGQTAAIEIDTPRLACDNLTPIGTVTFSGPANSITVNMSC